MDSGKMVQMNLFAKQNRVTDVENKLIVTKWGEGVGWIGRLGLMYIYITINKTDN